MPYYVNLFCLMYKYQATSVMNYVERKLKFNLVTWTKHNLQYIKTGQYLYKIP